MAEYKEIFACVLSDICEEFVKRKDIVDALPFEIADYDYKYSNYLLFREELESIYQEKLIDAFVGQAKYIIKEAIVGCGSDFYSENPEHSLVLRSYFDWLESNERVESSYDSFFKLMNDNDTRLDLSKFVKTYLNKGLLGFKKVKSTSGTHIYSKEFLKGNQLVVCADCSNKRPWVQFYIGIDDPLFVVDMNKILLLNKRAFYFRTKDELEKKMLKAIEVLNLISSRVIEGCEKGSS